jgi:ABC-type branched-subunit amino acid transport system permease subunit
VGAGIVVYITEVLSSSIPFAQTVLGLVFITFVLAARQGIVGAMRIALAQVRR